MSIAKVVKFALAALTGMTLATGVLAQAKPDPKWPTNLTLGTEVGCKS